MADVYEWDEAKRHANLDKHGIDFLRMTEFDWARAAVVPDRRRDYGESRFRAYGMVGESFCVVIFTLRRRGAYRIISVRRASRAERAKYEQGRA